MPDPADLRGLDELSFATSLEIRPVLASEADLDRAIELHLGDRARESRLPRAIDLPEDTSPLRGVSRTLSRSRLRGTRHGNCTRATGEVVRGRATAPGARG